MQLKYMRIGGSAVQHCLAGAMLPQCTTDCAAACGYVMHQWLLRLHNTSRVRYAASSAAAVPGNCNADHSDC